jgi:hypothetical protein
MIAVISYRIRQIIILTVIFLPAFSFSTNEIPVNNSTPKQRAGFIENKGQIIDQDNKPNPAVLYLLNTPGMNVQLRKGGFSYDLYESRVKGHKSRVTGHKSRGTIHQVSTFTASTSTSPVAAMIVRLRLQRLRPIA